jgi:hypothetical protein
MWNLNCVELIRRAGLIILLLCPSAALSQVGFEYDNSGPNTSDDYVEEVEEMGSDNWSEPASVVGDPTDAPCLEPVADFTIDAGGADDLTSGTVRIDGTIDVPTSVAGVPVDGFTLSASGDVQRLDDGSDQGGISFFLSGHYGGAETFTLSADAWFGPLDADALMDGTWTDGSIMSQADIIDALNALNLAAASLPDRNGGAMCNVNAAAPAALAMVAKDPIKCAQMLTSMISAAAGAFVQITVVYQVCNQRGWTSFACIRSWTNLAGQLWYFISTAINYYCECQVPKPAGGPLTSDQRFCQIVGNGPIPKPPANGGGGGGIVPPGPPLPGGRPDIPLPLDP